MSEQIHDQVSAFLDDELSSEECAFLARRLKCDEAARGKLVRFALCSSVMRREVLQPAPDLLRCRVREALDGGDSGAASASAYASSSSSSSASASASAAGALVSSGSSRVGRSGGAVWGVGVAASVVLAVAVIFVVSDVDDSPDLSATQVGRVASASNGHQLSAQTSIAPTSDAPTSVAQAPVSPSLLRNASVQSAQPVATGDAGSAAHLKLTNYLVRHGTYTSLLNRAWIYSTVVGEPTAGGLMHVQNHAVQQPATALLAVSAQQDVQ